MHFAVLNPRTTHNQSWICALGFAMQVPSLSFGAEAAEGAGDRSFPPTQQPTAPPPTPAAWAGDLFTSEKIYLCCKTICWWIDEKKYVRETIII